MKLAVIYTSKYGSTKQYAGWIAEALGGELFSAEGVAAEKLAAYDTVVIGGYLHIGKIIGVDFLMGNWSVLQSKKVVLFSVAGAPPNSPERVKWYEESVPAHIRGNIRHFAMQGRAMNLDFKDTMLMAFPRTLVRLKYLFNRTPENRKAMQDFKPFDGVTKEQIQPLVEYVRALSN